MKKDTIFQHPQNSIKSFEFNREVAEVFDDMVSRSVPFYHEIHGLINDLSHYYLPDGGLLYDLGCSTASTMVSLDRHLQASGKAVHFVGIDNSQAMIDQARKKLAAAGTRRWDLFCSDIEDVPLEPADMVIMNYTLQFLSPERRERLLKRIQASLKSGGLFLFSEKINCSNPGVDELVTDLYYDFKRRNGYSELEISQKREALEKVLIPYSPEKNLALLESAGFAKTEMIFRRYNFASFIGIK